MACQSCQLLPCPSPYCSERAINKAIPEDPSRACSSIPCAQSGSDGWPGTCHNNVTHLPLINPPPIFFFSCMRQSQIGSCPSLSQPKQPPWELHIPKHQTQPLVVPLLQHFRAQLREHLLVGMSCDLIPDHHILHQPLGIQPRVIMAYLHSSELPQVLAL